MKYTIDHFSKGECSLIASIDAESLISDVVDIDCKQYPPKMRAEYVASNLEAYYLVLNTWSFQLFEKQPLLLPQFKRIVVRTGLLAQIKNANHTADCVILHEGVMDPFFADIVSLYSEEEEREVLQVLRYPKRFSPIGASAIAEKSMADFIEVENRNKLRDRHEDSYYVVSRVREEVRLLTRNFRKQKGSFSNGAAKNSGKSIPEKVYSLIQDFPLWDAPQMWYSVATCPKAVAYDDRSVKVVAVPKSYKAVRLIAPEITSRQYFCQGVRRGLERAAMRNSKSVHFDDQTWNQRAAHEGSSLGTYATIDLSHASDTVKKTTVSELFPDDLATLLISLAPQSWIDGVTNKKKERTLYMFATSGNALTFAVETIIFLAIANAASKVFSSLTGEKVRCPYVFGDDSIVDTRVADLFIGFLETLGFVVNTEKSFCDPQLLYRESCGSEYYKGMDMSAKYFPRQPILIRDESDVWHVAAKRNPSVKRFIKPLDEESTRSLVSVISLQHRLYSSIPCREWLIDYIRKFVPDMTSHLPGVDCQDLWEPYPIYRDVQLPESLGYYAHREGHLTLIEVLDKHSKDKVTSAKMLAMKEVYEEYSYIRFLEFGPSYEDYLSEQLRISTPRPSFDSLFFDKKARWKSVNE